MNKLIDINSTATRIAQFDPDQPDSPSDARLDALYDGESEIAAE